MQKIYSNQYNKAFKFTIELSSQSCYLLYKRCHYDGYDAVNGDSIDAAIALYIKRNISKKISYELPLKDERLIYRSCSFNFNRISPPNYTFEFFQNKDYPKKISLDFAFETQNSNLIEKLITDDPYVHIPISLVDKLDTVNT